MAAAESRAPQICCVMLPEIETVGYLTAVLLALSKLQTEFPALLSEYARRGITVGQRVRVLPSGHVYRYAGVLPGYNESFKLEVVDASDKAWKTFAVSEILRLEPTERALPKGKGNTTLGTFELVDLDRLIGIHSGGNTSLFTNHVLYLSSRSDAQDLAASIVLARTGASGTHGVTGEVVPWGHITADGIVERDDRYQRGGEPLIAVTHSPDHLAEACERVPPFSKLVIVNEADKIARNLQAYDRIVQKQNLLIIASHRSTDAVELLAARGCRVWRLSPSDILHGESPSEHRTDGGAVSRLFRAVTNWKSLALVSVSCEDAVLDTVARQLELAASCLDPAGARDETKRIIGRLFSLLCSVGELFGDVDEATALEAETRLEAVARAIEQEAVWVPREVTLALREARAALRSAYRVGAGSVGGGKILALRGLITRLENEGLNRILVATRTAEAVSRVASVLSRRCSAAVVVWPLAQVDQFEEADAVILTAWPNSRRLSDVVGRYLAPSVYLIGYRFESAWFAGFKRQHSAAMRRGGIEPAMKSALTGLPSELFAPIERRVPADANTASPDTEVSGVVRIEDLLLRQRKGAAVSESGRDDLRPARYVGFFGTGYAYLSEWQNVPVVTALVQSRSEGRGRINLRTVNTLAIGDYVVFRGGAESNIIRSAAEQMTGKEQYTRLREVADAWRRSLWRLGLDHELRLADPPTIRSALQRWGLDVGLQTVRHWLYDETHIGPEKEEALVTIAKASSDQGLLDQKTKVWDAIRAVRALHMQAGHRLTDQLLQSIQQTPPQVGSRETKIDFAGAPAWIVQVEELGQEYEQTPSSHVNRLLFDADSF